MKDIHPILKSMFPLVDAVAQMLGSNCEVALHDLSQPVHSVVHIANGNISGRKVGDTVSSMFKELVQIAQNNEDMLVNYYDYENGVTSKCTKVLIKDENEKVIGCFCINLVIDDYLQGLNAMKQLCDTVTIDEIKNKQNGTGNSTEDISDVVKDIISNTCKELFQTKGKVSKDDKIEAVKFLEEKGIFRVKGSVDWVAKSLDVTRYTIYNYLEEIRS